MKGAAIQAKTSSGGANSLTSRSAGRWLLCEKQFAYDECWQVRNYTESEKNGGEDGAPRACRPQAEVRTTGCQQPAKAEMDRVIPRFGSRIASARRANCP